MCRSTTDYQQQTNFSIYVDAKWYLLLHYEEDVSFLGRILIANHIMFLWVYISNKLHFIFLNKLSSFC